MHSAVRTIFQAAHREVAEAKQLSQLEAQRFNQTFLLTTRETQELHAAVEMHVSGPAIELSVPSRDMIFSLRPVYANGAGRDRWELISFHGPDNLPQYLCTFYYGATQSDRARRLRGARLISAIGEYLGAIQADTRVVDAGVGACVLPLQQRDRVPEADAVRQLQQA